MSTDPQTPEVAHKHWYNGLTRYHWWVLIIGCMAWLFDCMDQRIFILARAPALRVVMGDEWATEKPNRAADISANAEKALTKKLAAGQAGKIKKALNKEQDLQGAREALGAAAISAFRAKLDAGQLDAVKTAVDGGQLTSDEAVDAYALEFNVATGKAFNGFIEPTANIITAAMITGWAVGGLFFGIVGDRWGRVRTLSTSIFVYSMFTGLSGLSLTWWDLCAYRFLMGCGIGGAFATAATLIAETLPAHSRAFALGMFQALSATGNITGSAIVAWVIQPGTSYELLGMNVHGWRLLFFIGVLPAFLIVFIMRTIKEPPQWQEAAASAKGNIDRQLGDLKSLFGHRRWRRNTLVGMTLAVAGVIGLWGVGFWSPELIEDAVQGDQEVVDKVKGYATLWQDVGAFFGMFVFTILATRIGRRFSFGLCFALCWVVVSLVFLTLSSEMQAYWMLPMVGFVTLSVFGGYAIYFPEIYPTRLRATGTALCYNVARVLAAAALLLKIPMKTFFEGLGVDDAFRTVAVVMCSVYLIGLVALFWAPETKGKPLPTDDD